MPAGEDLTRACASAGCAALQPGAWVCFAFNLSTDAASSAFLAVQLNRSSADARGDPDLFGLWFNSAAEPWRTPNTTLTEFDFQETSSGARALVTQTLRRADSPRARDADGAYLCVAAYAASVEFTLRATLDDCPNSFNHTGLALVCQSPKDNDAPEQRRYSECAAGQCVCKAPYAPPVPTVFPGMKGSRGGGGARTTRASRPLLLGLAQGWGLKNARR